MASLTGAAILRAAEEGEGPFLALLKSRAEELGGYLMQATVDATTGGRLHVAVQRARKGGPVGTTAEMIRGRRTLEVGAIGEATHRRRGETFSFLMDGRLEKLPVGAWTPEGVGEKGEEEEEEKGEKAPPKWVVVFTDNGDVSEYVRMERAPGGEVSWRIPYRYGLSMLRLDGVRVGALESGAVWLYQPSDPETGTVWLPGMTRDDNAPNTFVMVSPGLATTAGSVWAWRGSVLTAACYWTQTGIQVPRVQTAGFMASWLEGVFERLVKGEQLETHPYAWMGMKKNERTGVFAKDTPVPALELRVQRAAAARQDEVRALERSLESIEEERAKTRERLERKRSLLGKTVVLEPPDVQLMELQRAGVITKAAWKDGWLYVRVDDQRMVVTPDDVRAWARNRGTRWGEEDIVQRAGVYKAPPWVAAVNMDNVWDTRIWGIGRGGERKVSPHPHAGNGGHSGLPCWGDAKIPVAIDEALGEGDLRTVVRELLAYMGTINYEHGYSPPWDWAEKVAELNLPGVRPRAKVTVVKKAKVRVVQPPPGGEGEEPDEDGVDYEDEDE